MPLLQSIFLIPYVELTLLMVNHTFSELNISHCYLGRDTVAMENLAKAVADNFGLTRLDISSNALSPTGAVILANALKNNCSLQELNASYNKFGDVGVIALAEALTNNRTLTSLNLKQNKIEISGAQALAIALKDSSLTTLNVSGNKISGRGLKALLEPSTLTVLDVSYNEIGDAWVKSQAVFDPLINNCTLTHLNLT